MDKIKIRIDSLAFGGEGIGRVDGKVCFVRDALPGEVVVFNPRQQRSSYIRGELHEIVTPSPERTEPLCPYYGDCGGCQLQHITYEKEVFYKKSQAADLLRKIGGFAIREFDKIIPSKNFYYYRNSITLHRSGGKTGFYSRNGRDIVDIKQCCLADEYINKALSAGLSGNTKDRVTLKSDFKGKVWVSGNPGERFFTDRIGGKEMVLSPRVFSQCNRYITDKVAEVLGEWMGEKDADAVFFDVYCGFGLFSFLVKGDFAARIGMDNERTAIDCAKSTVRNSSFENMRFYRGTVEKDFCGLYERSRGRSNVIFLDPPRAGIKKQFVEWLSTVEGAGTLYYLSCDPARMARDLKSIVSKGRWTLGRTAVFDMFPRTRHIETMVELVCKA